MTLNYRLSELLDLRHMELGGNWRAVSKDIEARLGVEKSIDRRKLKKLAECSDTVRLSIAELRQLQEYLVVTRSIRDYENPFFMPSSNLLDGLRTEKGLTAFYPARPLRHFKTEGASRWDLRAIQALNDARQINSLNFSFQDVFHVGQACDTPQQLRKEVAATTWYKELGAERALIAIGAPYACLASEEILCSMFNRQPYEGTALDPENPLPFYFYWPDDDRLCDSAFSVTGDDLKRHFPKQFAEMDPMVRAVLIGGKLYPAPRFGESMNLVVAQYWRGHLVIVLLGVYAPSTLTVARLLAEGKLSESLGRYRYAKPRSEVPWESQPILITKIKTTTTNVTPESHGILANLRDDRSPAGGQVEGWERWAWNGEQFKMVSSGK